MTLHKREIKNVLDIIYRVVKRKYEQNNSPVSRFVRIRSDNTFRVLVGTILSSRTRDDVTSSAASRLFRLVKSPVDLKKLTVKQIEKAIYPVGFYKTKARYLKLLPEYLDRLFGGKIPDTLKDLCKLPGVGRKTANLVLAEAFGKPAICVDVHVHRISNRLGIVNTRTPYETEMALRQILPRRYWRTWNTYLVSYGQTICTPTRPRCNLCELRHICPSSRMKYPRQDSNLRPSD